MLVDSFMLAAVVRELNSELRGSVVRTAKSVAPFTVALALHQKSKGKFWFIASAHSRYAHIGWQRNEPKAEVTEHAETERFAEVLERQLERAVFVGAEQIDFDRLVVLQFVNITPLGERKRFALWCEIMGKHSNLVLVDSESFNIVDALKRLPSSLNRYREVLPGKPYIRPPSGDRRNPLTTNYDEIRQLAEKGTVLEPSDWAKFFFGMSDPLLKLMAGAVGEHLTNPEVFGRAVEWLKTTIEQGSFSPVSWRNDRGEIVWCYPLPLSSPPALEFHDSTPEPSFGPVLTVWLSHLSQKEVWEQRRQSLLGVLRRNLEGIETQISELEQRLRESEDTAKYRRWGELLLTFAHEIEPDVKEAVLIDYDLNPPQPVHIPLPEGKTPVEAAQHYFTLYRKLKSAAETLPSVIERLKKRADEVRRTMEEVKSADEKRLSELAAQVSRALAKTIEPVTSQLKPEREGDFLRFTVFGGYEVWVGKNADANSKLLRLARPDDLWFHVKGAPGAHALLRVQKRNEQVPQKAIEEAAKLAAYFSKRRTSSWVEVDYTRARYVRPAKGQKGLALYTNFKTIAVEPKPTHGVE